MKYKVIDLFAGAGGLSFGFSQTGRFAIVAAAENNTNARKTYKRNHKTARLYSDVHMIDYDELVSSLGSIDVVVGGPPCQGFSNANRQQSTLISMNNRLVKEYVRAIRELHPKAFVMENVAMLRSNIHRFIVEEEDLNDPIVMALNIKNDKLVLLPSGIDFPNALEYAKNSDNVSLYMWDKKKYKAINILYRSRINPTKFENAINRYKGYLTTILTEILNDEVNNEGVLEKKEQQMATVLLQYMDGQDISFNILIDAIKTPLFIQRMLGKVKELADNQIHIEEYGVDNSGAVSVVVQSYAVLDYVKGMLASEPYNYSLHPMLLNAIDYGAPQKRERFVLVGVQPGFKYEPPSRQFDEEHRRTVYDAIYDLQDISTSTVVNSAPIHLSSLDEISDLGKELRGKLLYNHVTTATRKTAMERFKALKEGQNFHDLDSQLKTTYSNADRTQNTIYMRLRYDEPSGTVVNVRKSMWIHPILDRAISIREAARLQTFPDYFVFEGTKDSQYQQVGNAVPPLLARAIADSIVKALDSNNE